jgi:hypothetical protein
MFKVLAFLTRKSGVSRKEFRRYYEQCHVPLIRGSVAAQFQYRRNFMNSDDPLSRGAEDFDFDVVTELEFSDREAFVAWSSTLRAPGSVERVAADEDKFLDRSRIRICVVDCRTSTD